MGGASLCECGCGAPVRRRFVSGHNRRGADPATRYVVEDRGFTSPCWIWSGRIYADGYGKLMLMKKNTSAHRVMFEREKGSVEPGLEIDHLCRNRACVNPAHLEAVTRRENIMRGESPSAVNARKTHCQNGHPFSGENLAVVKGRGGHCRICRACRLAYNAMWRLKNPGYRHTHGDVIETPRSFRAPADPIAQGGE